MENITTIYGAPEGQDARILADKAREAAKNQEVLLHIALDDGRIEVLKELFSFFAPDVAILDFPAWDCLPYDRVSPTNDIVARRVVALGQLLSWQRDDKYLPRIVLTTVNAATQRVMPQGVLEKSTFSISEGSHLDMDALCTHLAGNGYVRNETVREAGEYAIRGGIIDLFPSDSELPTRIDLFGDEVDSMRTFDPLTQQSDKAKSKEKSLTLNPVTEFFLDEESQKEFRKNYRERFGVVKDDDPLYSAVSEGRRYNGADHWLPLFYDKPLSTLFDYIPQRVVTLDAQTVASIEERLAQVDDFFSARQTLAKAASTRKKNSKKGHDVSLTGAVYNPLPIDTLYLTQKESVDLIISQAAMLSAFAAPDDQGVDGGGRRGRDFSDVRALPDGNVLAEVSTYLMSAHIQQKRTLVACYSDGARDRLRLMLQENGVSTIQSCSTIDDVKKLKKTALAITVLPLENGFESDDIVVLTEQDILGDRLARQSKKRKKADNFLTEVSSLDVGDLVVHVDHGIGRFDGLETLEAAGTLHDCLKISYAGDDRLFVPVENIEVLSRYGSDEGTTQLDKLGGAAWQARKAQAKRDLMKMAEHLMKIAAARVLRKGEKISVESDVFTQFVARFPYQETDDHLKCVGDVLEDLDSGMPMDRLICGDVGFGKTEVAMRAAFVAAMAGMQVAIVAPTTLLVRQHYAGFLKRFEGFGLRIEQLSRLATAKEVKETKEGLTNGDVNIVVGTHAIFAQDVKFANLGLVIVDEEQRFGVKQKERLKELKNDVHILTLSATPIPRTLQMSLSGVKEMSLITTPPVDRLAIRTFVLPTDPMVLREALMREHYRGGQSFYVVPRIKDIKDVSDQLKELVPELKFIAAHGQMSGTDLEDRMSAFYDRKYDVLLATNIIESGIDIPNANTMIVHRADLFGLAQLYQIRGRIGRSKVRAYAYLTHDPHKKLTAQGQKRLEVIETLDTLGAGFQLASHDMDIRGAGNLLGEEQSGHIKEIGVELYQQMLEEAVAMAKAGVDITDGSVAPDVWSPQINIGTSVLIPENYVEDLSVRMSLYRRLADLDGHEAIEGFAAELIDRFGDIPDGVQNLVDIVSIKQLCRRAGVSHVDAGPKGAVIGFHNNTPPDPVKVMNWIDSKKGSVKIRPKDQKIVAVRHWETPIERVKGVRGFIKELVF